jgi:hypothetical protein
MFHYKLNNFVSLIQVKYYYSQPNAQYYIHITVLLYIHDIVHLVHCNKWIHWSEMFRVNDLRTLIQVPWVFLESWFILHNLCLYSVCILFLMVCRSLLANIHALVQGPIRSWQSEQQLRDCCSCWVTLVQQPSPWNLPLRLVIRTRIWTKVERYILCSTESQISLFIWTFVNKTCRVHNLSFTHSPFHPPIVLRCY